MLWLPCALGGPDVFQPPEAELATQGVMVGEQGEATTEQILVSKKKVIRNKKELYWFMVSW